MAILLVCLLIRSRSRIRCYGECSAHLDGRSRKMNASYLFIRRAFKDEVPA